MLFFDFCCWWLPLGFCLCCSISGEEGHLLDWELTLDVDELLEGFETLLPVGQVAVLVRLPSREYFVVFLLNVVLVESTGLPFGLHASLKSCRLGVILGC
jgi:hypothetical protein